MTTKVQQRTETAPQKCQHICFLRQCNNASKKNRVRNADIQKIVLEMLIYIIINPTNVYSSNGTETNSPRTRPNI
jgi:hypothetical protein